MASTKFKPAPVAKVTFAEEDFITLIFRLFWETNRKQEPQQYFSFRDAFQALIDFTGLDRRNIALRLGVTTSYLGMIESGKRLGNAFHYSQLMSLAESYSLPILATYFENWMDRAMNSQGATKSRKVRRGLGEDRSDWRDEMGNW